VIGIDTNVLVRYIVQDDPRQASAANTLIENVCNRDNPAFINHIILYELVWVLRRNYKVTRNKIADIIEQIMRTAQFQVHAPQLVWRALQEFKNGSADFPDCLVAQINLANDCPETVTFDINASKTKGFRLLS